MKATMMPVHLKKRIETALQEVALDGVRTRSVRRRGRFSNEANHPARTTGGPFTHESIKVRGRFLRENMRARISRG
jgi:hypothetical protein